MIRQPTHVGCRGNDTTGLGGRALPHGLPTTAQPRPTRLAREPQVSMATKTTERPETEGAPEQQTDGPLLDLTDASVKRMIKLAKKRGYVTYDELNEVLPQEEFTSEQIDRTDDPVRMYLREMGSVELLSREGEIAIAKRIEAGREAMIAGLCESPLTFQAIIIWRDELNEGKVFLRDIIDLEATYAGPDAKAMPGPVIGQPVAGAPAQGAP